MDHECCLVHQVRPLGLACGLIQSVEIVSILLESGANPDPAGPHLRELHYPLHAAIGRGNIFPGANKIVERLILAGSKVNIVASNCPPLYLAAQMDDIESARLLIQAGADTNYLRAGDRETTVLSYASYHGSPEMIIASLLLASGVDLLS